MTDPAPEPAPDAKTCQVCPTVFTRPPGMKPYRWAETVTCGRSCGSRLAALTRRGGEVGPHHCALPGCDIEVPRVEGEHESRYRARKYCSEEHRREAARVSGGTARTPPAWKVELRCACPCARAFVPGDKDQRYATHACSVAARRARTVGEPDAPAAAPDPEPEPAPPLVLEQPLVTLVERTRTVWRPAAWGGEYTVTELVEVVA